MYIHDIIALCKYIIERRIELSPSKGYKSNDPIEKISTYRTNKETSEKLEYVSKETGKSKSEIIRNGIEIQYQKLKK